MERIVKLVKSVTLFVLSIFLTGAAYCQTVTFMGVDIDQSYTSFNQSISSKIRYVEESSTRKVTLTQYSGTFAGMRNCYIAVYKTPQNHVETIVVIVHNIGDDEYNKLVASYISKYGQPYKIESTVDSDTLKECYSYQFKIENHLIQVARTPRNGIHILYKPRWFILNTDDI